MLNVSPRKILQDTKKVRVNMPYETPFRLEKPGKASDAHTGVENIRKFCKVLWGNEA